MGQMASMFFNKVGVNLFYFCIIIYLYGDLAIYAAAVPVSLMQVTCSVTGNHSCSVGDGTKYNDTDKCWGPIRRIDAYRLYLAAFTLLLGPFTFFNVQKTKYLQIMTSLMRWIGESWQGLGHLFIINGTWVMPLTLLFGKTLFGSKCLSKQHLWGQLCRTNKSLRRKVLV